MSTTQSQPNEIWGHPKGLFVLFLTEMWERFSYYGMRVLLVLYMTKYLFQRASEGYQIAGFDLVKAFYSTGMTEVSAQALSSKIYGLYTGLVYLTPFFGGMLADRFIGKRRSVYIGGLLMAIGHFLMAFESLFFIALVFLIFGNGFFKPNISTQVGDLYAADDKRRDGAYTIFYMGINLGAIFSPLVCGTLGQTLGWHYGFAAAGVGMLISIVIYHFGRKHLPTEQGHPADRAANDQKNEPLTWTEKKSIIALLLLCTLNIFFWGVYEQQGNTLQLWSDANTEWNFFGINIPTTWYQSFNPLMIIAFAPLLNVFWRKQSENNKEPNSIMKMGYGCLLLGSAMLVMVLAAHTVGDGKGSLLWLTFCTLLLTIGELYLSPIGLSLVSKVAPRKFVSMLMGIWLMSSAFGNVLSGEIGAYYEVISKTNFFYLLSALGFVAGFAFIATNRFLSKALAKGI